MEPLWHNRRVQRSAAFAFFFLTLTLIFLWTRESWPAIPQSHHSPGDKFAPYDKVSAPANTAAAIPDDPLYKSIAEYDAAHMPAIPTVVANPVAVPVATKAPAPPVAPVAAPAYVNPALDPTRVALIIETRPQKVLPALLVHMISVLPPQWVVKMVGTNDSFSSIQHSRALKHHIASQKLQLVDLPPYYPMTGQETVSQTLTNITFYRDFMRPAEWILMFQTDSIMCAASEQSVDDWVDKNYSWVGAPWYADVRGGNGGLSLRNVSAVVKLLEQQQRPVGYRQWEDMWLSEKLNDTAALGADEVSFSVESMYYEKPLGYHLRGSGTLLDGEVWNNQTRKRQILEYCPEVKIVLGNMRMALPNQTEAILEEQRLDAKAAEAAISAAASAAKAAAAAANVTQTSPEQSAAANALAEAAALADAAALSPSQGAAYAAKQAEASRLVQVAAEVESLQAGRNKAGFITANAVETQPPQPPQPPSQVGVKELEGASGGGYTPQEAH